MSRLAFALLGPLTGPLTSPRYQIATTQFWILSKVSRVDYPRAWPDLAQRQLNALIASAQTHLSSDPSSSPAEPGLMNALVALNRLVKEWTTIKLPLGSKVLAEWAALLLPVLVPLLEELGRRPADTRLATWTAKTVGRLAVWDWSRLASSKDPDGPARAHLVFGLVVGQLGAKVAERSALLGAMRASEEARGEDARRRLAELTAFVKGALKYLRVRRLASSMAVERPVVRAGTDACAPSWAGLSNSACRRPTRASLPACRGAAPSSSTCGRSRARTSPVTSTAVRPTPSRLLLCSTFQLTIASALRWPDRPPGRGPGGGRVAQRVQDHDAAANQRPAAGVAVQAPGRSAPPLAAHASPAPLRVLISSVRPVRRRAVMTPAFIADLFETLVDGALLLSEADLEELDDDAEEWCVRESSSNEQWTFELRVRPPASPSCFQSSLSGSWR